MKTILCFMLLILSFAGSAFAATALSTSSTQTAIYGGADTDAASKAATPLIRFSTNVTGQVNFTAKTDKTCSGYLIATRHSTGSKNFATTNVLTNIFWKQAKVDKTQATNVLLLADVGTDDETGSTFAPGNGWTSY